MAETSLPWDGTAIGDATLAPYDAPTEFALFMRIVSAAGVTANEGGVAAGEDGSLLVTGTASPISVTTGMALVYGTAYQNDAAVSVTIPTPAGATRIDRVVLRKSWTTQTVRITRIAGVEGGTAPAMVQTEGVTWDIPLALVSITTGGVVTVVDAREFIGGNVMTVVKTKAADETVNNSDTLQDDNDLFFAIGPSETWQITISLLVTIRTASDLKVAIALPAGATMALHMSYAGAIGGGSAYQALAAQMITPGAGVAVLNSGGAPVDVPIKIVGFVTNSTVAGSCNFQWAQNAAVSENTTVYAGGSLVAHKLAS